VGHLFPVYLSCQRTRLPAADMYSGTDYLGAVVADIGSHSARIGFAGEDCPRVAMPTVS
jgi:hypothetical protein